MCDGHIRTRARRAAAHSLRLETFLISTRANMFLGASLSCHRSQQTVRWASSACCLIRPLSPVLWGPLLAFSSCDQTPDQNSLTEERVLLGVLRVSIHHGREDSEQKGETGSG
ncbi:rCG32410 [Rattus norvegicus]|uniref:RCG32410 n=1 Tax=Rattus norvegicus TaxID=10116 RepID=A6JXS0_RAT|nr:rCG32410 [Rattus norvegicus]